MKTSVLIFLTGLVLGIAGTLSIRRDSHATTDPTSPSHTAGMPARTRADRSGQPSERGGRSDRRKKSKSTATTHSSNGARDDLESFLSAIRQVEDEELLDVMSVVRSAALLTRLREDEALDLLQLLSRPVEDGDSSDDEEFRLVAGIIVFCRLCELNGPQAMRLGAKIDDDTWKIGSDELLTMGMNSWVAADPEGARMWFEGLLGEADKTLALDEDVDLEGMAALLEEDAFRAAYINGMAKHDPEGIEQRMAALQHNDIREAMQNDLMQSLVRNEESVEGLQALLEKSGNTPDARLVAVEKLCTKDPRAATQWVESQAAGQDRDQQIGQVASVLMKKNEATGIEWYMNQEMAGEGQRSNRYDRIVSHLANDDVQKASEWLGQQTDDITRDSAEESIAVRLAYRKNWQESIRWVASIHNDDTRKRGLNNVLGNGWDPSEGALRPEVLEAADAAGLGEAARDYRPD